jgi:hypothetical protein
MTTNAIQFCASSPTAFVVHWPSAAAAAAAVANAE